MKADNGHFNRELIVFFLYKKVETIKHYLINSKLFRHFLLLLVFILINCCAQSQNTVQSLKDKNKKQEIFSAILNDSALLTEFMDTMMKNPKSSKRMMNEQCW
jgi:PBP1b-binding outer membrane lipoprotein LpoB